MMHTRTTAAQPPVGLDIEDGVATITLQAPERHNALDAQMAQSLIEVFDDVAGRADVGAVVLGGAGRSFCAGADQRVLREAGRDPLDPAQHRAISLIYDSFYRFGQLPVPTIAAARGACIGAGLNLLLAADLRIVSATATISSGFAAHGLHPGGGHFHLLARTAGREVAAAVGVFGVSITGRQAAECGIAWEATADADTDRRAHELAVGVAARPDLARRVVASFRAESESLRTDWAIAIQAERSHQLVSMRDASQAEADPT